MFVEHIKQEDIPWQSVKERHIKNYNMNMKQIGYSDHSIARKNSSIRLFLKHLRKQGIMLHNPMEDIRQPLLQKREVQLTEEEKEQLAEKMKAEARDYLIYTLLSKEKLKVSEIIELKWEQINQQNLIIYLPKRAVSIQLDTLQVLEEMRTDEVGGYILKNQHGKPLSVNGVHFILKKYFKEINREDIRPNDLAK